MSTSLLAGFLIKCILWLLVCLAAWYPLGFLFAAPVAWLASGFAQLFFSGWVEGVERTGTTLHLLTTLQVVGVPAGSNGDVGLLTPEADFLSYGYGLPLLLAFFLASRPKHMLIKMLIGACALLPFQAISILFAWLKQVAIQAGPTVAVQLQFSDLSRNLIGLGYQFGTLVLPTLVPVIVWLLLDRKLITTLLLEAYLEKANPDN